MKVYQAINAVQAALARDGIAKDRKNEMQGYKFRGIDDVFNALSPLLSRHGLCILPRCMERICVERVNAKGTALFYVTVRAEFDFVCSEDGSRHTVITYGEAMDSGDKATNKAMSAAYKYAAMQAFSIPTEGDNDADAHTHEVAGKSATEVLLERSIEVVEQQKLGALAAAAADAGKVLDNPTKTALSKLAFELGELFKRPEKGIGLAFDRIEIDDLNGDEKTYLWGMLDSKLRSALKRESQIRALKHNQPEHA